MTLLNAIFFRSGAGEKTEKEMKWPTTGYLLSAKHVGGGKC